MLFVELLKKVKPWRQQRHLPSYDEIQRQQSRQFSIVYIHELVKHHEWLLNHVVKVFARSRNYQDTVIDKEKIVTSYFFFSNNKNSNMPTIKTFCFLCPIIFCNALLKVAGRIKKTQLQSFLSFFFWKIINLNYCCKSCRFFLSIEICLNRTESRNLSFSCHDFVFQGNLLIISLTKCYFLFSKVNILLK